MANSSQKSPAKKATATRTRAKKKAGVAAKAAPKPAVSQPTAPKAKAKTPPPPSDVDTADGDTGTSPGTSQGGNAFSGGLHMGESENYLDFLSRMFQDMDAAQWNTQQFDSMTQSMNLVLGSGPAFATLESMMAHTTAQGAVLMNAVQTQRQLDQVGLCCTSACVKQLLNMNNNNQDSD